MVQGCCWCAMITDTSHLTSLWRNLVGGNYLGQIIVMISQADGRSQHFVCGDITITYYAPTSPHPTHHSRSMAEHNSKFIFSANTSDANEVLRFSGLVLTG